ncbi:O-antigen ligase [Lysinibacillus composti]|uniref:Polymerase n=1 Tax=Lysinibacillus composti TaxID=720633 RepID=A0A3N9UH58_9BACI|nr:O-antigen ligase family protein [Lysinibacillus composti]MBM7607999.1 O-antigen ligase [Lysinibacillus composti]RQW75459.1 polymerase [Lysinibacillus composti]
MKDISTDIGRKEWLEIILAIAVLIAATLLPTSIALVSTTIFFILFAFFKPFQSLVVLIPYVIFRSFFTELNTGMKLIGDLITFIVLIRLLLLNIKHWKTWFHFKKFEWFFFLFLIFGAVIGYLNGVSVASIVFQVRTFIIMYLLYYILSRSKLPRNFFVKLAWITVFSGFVLFVQGIVEKLSLRSMWMPEAWSDKVLSSTNFVRIYGLVNNPNSLALVMFFAVSAAFFLRFVYQDGKYKVLLMISEVAFIGLLLLTLSRGTWISSFVFVLFFMLISRNWKILKQMVLTFLVALILVYFPVNFGVILSQYLGVENETNGEVSSGGLSNRFKETIDSETIELMTQSGRLFYIKKGFEVLSDYPLTGAGFGTFGGSATLSYDSPIYEEYGIRSDIYGGKNFYSDNQYIQVIAETGAIGVLLFAGFLLTMLWMFWKDRKSTFAQYMFALWFATGFAGVVYNIWELKVYTMFYFMLFAIYVATRNLYPMLELSKFERELSDNK